jgi:hypothetical protein
MNAPLFDRREALLAERSRLLAEYSRCPAESIPAREIAVRLEMIRADLEATRPPVPPAPRARRGWWRRGAVVVDPARIPRARKDRS